MLWPVSFSAGFSWGSTARLGHTAPVPGRPAESRTPPTPSTSATPLQSPLYTTARGYDAPPATRRAGHRTDNSAVHAM